MPTVALPSSTAAQAEAVIAQRLKRPFSLKTRLEELGSTTAVQLMLDLEQRFGVLIDVDEVLPHGTIGCLVTLAVMRAPLRAAPEACTLIDLAAARAERARRAQERFGIPDPPPVTVEAEPEFEREYTCGRDLLRLAFGSLAAGAFAAVVAIMLFPRL